MTTAILDTNVLVQSVISSPSSSSARVLDAYFTRRFEIILSPAVLDEWLEVLLVPTMRERHGLSDDEIMELLASLLAAGRCIAEELGISHSLTRDITDTKFLALAQASDADYLVTNDRRHLLPLKQFSRTRIVLPRQFLRELPPS